jgi:cytosine/adenosine deaminase-related metal-dependent hydrolase
LAIKPIAGVVFDELAWDKRVLGLDDAREPMGLRREGQEKSMASELLIKHVRPLGGEPVDLLVRDGVIQQIGSELAPTSSTAQLLDGKNQLLLPGLVNAHAHIDKNLLGLPSHKNQVPGPRIRDFVDNERKVRRELNLSARTQSAREVRAAVVAGTTHIRTHVDVDTDAGLAHIEGVLATRDELTDLVTIQIVAFPQSGMLVRPGTAELLEEVIKLGRVHRRSRSLDG